MKQEIILNLNDVTKIFSGPPEVVAVKNINLEITKSDFVALVGSSGSGKTTLLNLCSGLDKPSSGKISICSKELSKMSNHELTLFRAHNIGFVFQAYNLFPVLTALENVEYTLLIRGEKQEIAKEKSIKALQLVDLEDKANRMPNQLSGGQQQRIAVARALACEPKIIFADEPTANLDSKTAIKLVDLFQQLNEEKKVTFIFSTHDHKLYQNVKTKIEMLDGSIENIRS
jgi:putative ABC transport system ATP-binding protein